MEAVSAKPDAEDLNVLYSKNPDDNVAWALAVKLRNCKDLNLTKQITFKAEAALRQGGRLFDTSAFILAGQGEWGHGALGRVLVAVDDRDTVEKISKILLTASTATNISFARDSMLAFLEKDNAEYEYAQRNVFYAFANEGRRKPAEQQQIASRLEAIQKKRTGNQWFIRQIERMKLRWTDPHSLPSTPTLPPPLPTAPAAPIDYKAKFEAMLQSLPEEPSQVPTPEATLPPPAPAASEPATSVVPAPATGTSTPAPTAPVTPAPESPKPASPAPASETTAPAPAK